MGAAGLLLALPLAVVAGDPWAGEGVVLGVGAAPLPVGALPEAEGEAVPLPAPLLPLLRGLTEGLGVSDRLVDGEAESEGLAVEERLPRGEREARPLPVAVPPSTPPLGVLPAVRVEVPPVGLPVEVVEGRGEAVEEGLGRGLREAEAKARGEEETVGLRAGEREARGLLLPALPEAVPLAVLLSTAVTEGEAEVLCVLLSSKALPVLCADGVEGGVNVPASVAEEVEEVQGVGVGVPGRVAVPCEESEGAGALGEAEGSAEGVGPTALRLAPSPASDAVGSAPEGVTEGLCEAEPLARGEEEALGDLDGRNEGVDPPDALPPCSEAVGAALPLAVPRAWLPVAGALALALGEAAVDSVPAALALPVAAVLGGGEAEAAVGEKEAGKVARGLADPSPREGLTRAVPEPLGSAVPLPPAAVAVPAAGAREGEAGVEGEAVGLGPAEGMEERVGALGVAVPPAAVAVPPPPSCTLGVASGLGVAASAPGEGELPAEGVGPLLGLLAALAEALPPPPCREGVGRAEAEGERVAGWGLPEAATDSVPAAEAGALGVAEGVAAGLPVGEGSALALPVAAAGVAESGGEGLAVVVCVGLPVPVGCPCVTVGAGVTEGRGVEEGLALGVAPPACREGVGVSEAVALGEAPAAREGEVVGVAEALAVAAAAMEGVGVGVAAEVGVGAWEVLPVGEPEAVPPEGVGEGAPLPVAVGEGWELGEVLSVEEAQAVEFCVGEGVEVSVPRAAEGVGEVLLVREVVRVGG